MAVVRCVDQETRVLQLIRIHARLHGTANVSCRSDIAHKYDLAPRRENHLTVLSLQLEHPLHPVERCVGRELKTLTSIYPQPLLLQLTYVI